MSWSGRRVLVTGAAGFIGSHLVERLVDAGATVRAFVRYNSAGSAGFLDESARRDDVEIHAGDVRDADSVRAAMARVDVVFHLAALIGIPYSYSSPASYVRTNVEGTLHVLQAAREVGVERVVHTSTSEVYGTACRVPIDETHPLRGQSPYSASKIGADALAESYWTSFEVPVVTLRPFNTYGPRQSARAVIPAIIVQCLWEDRLHLGSTHPTRDFTHVRDTVSGFLLAGSTPGIEGRTIQLGSGVEISVGDLADRIRELVGRPVTVVPAEDRVRPARSEVERLLANNALARSLLGWQPGTELVDGLKETITWIRERRERFRSREYRV